MVEIVRTLRLVLLLLVCPSLAYATGVTLDRTLQAISPLAAALVFALSTVLGLAALLNTLKDQTPPRLLAYVMAHMLSSWAAGFGAFVFGEYSEMNDWLEVGVIMAAAYGGARVLEVVKDRLLHKIGNSKGTP